jgi:hypothetical protein
MRAQFPELGMPNVDVAMAVKIAFVARKFGGVRRWLGVAFAISILIGSIQLACTVGAME